MKDGVGDREDLLEGSHSLEEEVLRKAPSEPGRGLCRVGNS